MSQELQVINGKRYIVLESQFRREWRVHGNKRNRHLGRASNTDLIQRCHTVTAKSC